MEMTHWLHEEEMDQYKTYSAAEAAYDAMWFEVSQLTRPVRFYFREECTLIECFRDGKPVFEGDPRLTAVPF
jgi:hypothetical protein